MRLLVTLAVGLLAAAGAAAAAPDGFPDLPGAKQVPLLSLNGWADDDHARTFLAFQRTCVGITNETAAIRSAKPSPAALVATCRDALAEGETDEPTARRFLETRFDAFEVPGEAGPGFLTGYYEPDFEGSLERTAEFPVPLLARPDDLEVLGVGETRPGVPPGILGARRTASGYEAYPDRAAIEDGALGAAAKPVVFLKDRADAFIVQVQGSASIRLAGGRSVRVAFAGRNGRPYTSVARVLRERLSVPAEELTADRLTQWIRANPAEARDLLRLNQSYIFFRLADELTAEDGPIGAAGMPLAAGRSIAIDRSIWPFGLPVWLDGEVPVPGGGSEPLRRLTVGQDTGTAITGPARADLFVGSGPDAGARAGLLRNPVRFVVLWPKSGDGAPSRRP